MDTVFAWPLTLPEKYFTKIIHMNSITHPVMDNNSLATLNLYTIELDMIVILFSLVQVQIQSLNPGFGPKLTPGLQKHGNRGNQVPRQITIWLDKIV